MSTPTKSEWSFEPFRMGTAPELERLRNLLIRSGYTERELCEAAGVPSVHELRPVEGTRSTVAEVTDARSLLTRLFVDCDPVPRTVIESMLHPEGMATLDALGLLVTSPADPDYREATIALYPTNGVYVASDRHWDVRSTGAAPPRDIIFTPLSPETFRFLNLMPRIPCEDYLELCSGAGTAALIAASAFAKRVTAVDITDRATRFGRFNAVLNGLTNVTVLEGDLYAPVRDQTFDLIVAHPPYVPNFETEYVFRDAGEDGEQITRQVIGGLPTHLRPGGQFYCDCLMSDRTTGAVEDRVREMLGECAREFDVVIGQVRAFDPIAYAMQPVHGKISFEVAQRRSEVFARLGIQRFVSVTMLIQRIAEPRAVATTRRLVTLDTGSEDFQWVIKWLGATAGWKPADARQLLDSRPRRLAHVELHSRSIFRDTDWEVVESKLATVAPFAAEARCDPGFAQLLAWCDGQATGRALLRRLQETGLAPSDASEESFAGVIERLVDTGMVEIDEFRLPDSTAGRAPRTSG